MGTKIGIVLVVFTCLIALAGCVPGGGHFERDNPAGFFTGVWHGWIAPVTLIWGLFDKNVRIYEIYNVGWWYDFGYYIAVIGGFGGIALSRRKPKKKAPKEE